MGRPRSIGGGAPRLLGAGLLALAVQAGGGSAAAVVGALEVTEIETLIQSLVELVRANYVDEGRLEAIESRLVAGLRSRRYELAASREGIARLLTSDLRHASGDLHFGVRPRQVALPGTESGADAHRGPGAVSSSSRGEEAGLGDRRVLAGDIGYLEIRALMDPEIGAEAVDEAFEELAATVALILDVRASRGGHPGMVAYLLSYFFDREPFVFNRFHWRNSGRTLELRTLADLPSPRYVERDLFVLTSRRTPSAAEGLAYHLKHLGRAVVVGERTAGAAHTYEVFEAAGFDVAIPTGRPTSTITGSNWGGTGVLPDHAVPAERALDAAHRLAIAAQRPETPLFMTPYDDGVLDSAGYGTQSDRLRNDFVRPRGHPRQDLRDR